MAPEPALVLAVLAALAAGVLRRRPRLALGVAGALGASSAAALALGALPGPASPFGLRVDPEFRAFALAADLGLAATVMLARDARGRAALLVPGLVAAAGLLALGVARDPVVMAVAVLVLGVGHALLPGTRPFTDRLRAPGLAAALLVAAGFLEHATGSPVAGRLGALALVLAIVAAAGLVPMLPQLEVGEPAVASVVAWTALLGPALAIAVTGRVAQLVALDSVAVYGAALVGLGLLNVAWGGAGAWLVEDDLAAWRYSFIADWGLALVGLGLVVRSGVGAAFLVLVSIVLVRLPLYLWALPVIRRRRSPAMGAANLLLGAAFVGIAPFAGFAARVLLLRAATELYWPLALVLGAGMLLWLGHAFRLARSVGRPTGRGAVAIVLALVASLALGLAPEAVLFGAGL